MYKVMVVEDEPPIARYLIRLLEQLGRDFQVVAAGNNGQEGLELFWENRPDIVITDVRMPGMNGLKMIEKIKEAGLKTQFLIISDYQDFEYARDGLRLGVHNYLIKPVTAPQLEENLEELRRILEEERKKDGRQILRDILKGNTDTDEAEHLSKRTSRWQLILIQQGCVMNPQMKYLLRAEEAADLCQWEPERFLSAPEHVAAWMSQEDRNVTVCLWDAGGGLFKEEMILPGSQDATGTIVTSEVFGSLKKASDLYAECNKALYYGTVIGRLRFIGCGRPQPVQPSPAAFGEWEQNVAQAVKLNHFELLKQELLSLFADMERMDIPQYTLENVLQRLFFLLSEKRMITIEQEQEGLAEIICFSKTMEDVLGGVLSLIMTGWDMGEEQTKNRKKGQQMMETIDEHIRRNLNEVFSLQDLSDSFYLSKTYICRLFRDYKGMSFKDYIIGIKMDKARELLGKGESVKQVSEYLGYMDPFYFSRVFKKREGVSPSEYIRKTGGIL